MKAILRRWRSTLLRRPSRLFWLTWGVTWALAAGAMGELCGLNGFLRTLDLSRFPKHAHPLLAIFQVLMLASGVATFMATRLCRRLGLSREAQRAEVLQRSGSTAVPAGQSVVVPARPPVRTALEALAVLAVSIVVFGLARSPRLTPPTALPVWPLPAVIGLLAIITLVSAFREQYPLVLADDQGVRSGVGHSAMMIPWNLIAGCTIETTRDVLGNTTATRLCFQGRTGSDLGTLTLDHTVPPAQQQALIALVRTHHGLPPEEPLELEASPAPEGTGTELEGVEAPARDPARSAEPQPPQASSRGPECQSVRPGGRGR